MADTVGVLYATGIAVAAFGIWKLYVQPRYRRQPDTSSSSSSSSVVLPPSPAKPLRHFTLEELKKCRGKEEGEKGEKGEKGDKGGGGEGGEGGGGELLIGLMGRVYDVGSNASGQDFYGPGGPYHLFSGRDATRALATMSMSEQECDLKPSLWTCGLSLTDKQTLSDWIDRFESKYAVVGKVVFGDEEEDSIVNRHFARMEQQETMQQHTRVTTTGDEDLTDLSADFYQAKHESRKQM
eukprot:GHVS01022503.1.p1 GENE.GHVS01022503.1~~GHVS01022503.1.p1  ORF type:complete len:238 (+),score=89.04 GHVS01022503.1:75-788(+)